jgi:ABC-type dipeptide/oligopeptide/nickel transport system ATPase component
MTKLEIMASLPPTGNQLTTLEAIQQLRQESILLHQDLQGLPAAIAQEVKTSLKPLTTLEQSVTKTLKAYEELTAHQRQILDQLTEEMTAKATEAFEARVKKIDSSLTDLTSRLKGILPVPEALTTAAAAIQQAADNLKEVRLPLWRQMTSVTIVALCAGLFAGAIALGGRAFFDERAANYLQVLMSHATPDEQQAIKAIANRTNRPSQ